MIRSRKIQITITILILVILAAVNVVQAQSPVVRAVLFYSPTCPHCKKVIEEFLPVLDQQYGSQVQIYGVNTYTEAGSALFESYVELFDIPQDLQAVPALVVGDQYLIGDKDIPEKFPAIIEEGLKNGGIDWPEIPGLQEAMAAGNPETESPDPTGLTEVHELTLKEKFSADLAGNTLAVIVLAGMLISLGYAGINLTQNESQTGKTVPAWVVPLLALVGMGVAGYLAYVEFNQLEAVCGPVGNCNTVQQSPYATLFGFLPVGVLGVLGYIAILVIWLLELLELPVFNKLLRMALWAVTLFGTLFSIYLTFLEPFVIGASCMWCLSSAVIITTLFLVATWQLSSPKLTAKA